MIEESDPDSIQGETSVETKARPQPPQFAKNARRVTEEEHDCIFAAWKSGMRSSVALAAKFGYSDETMRVMIKFGNKRRGWQPFAMQQALEEASMHAASSAATEKIAAKISDAWEKAKEIDLALINGNKRIVGEMIQKFIQAVKTVDFSAMTGTAACHNARALAAAVDTLVKAESLLLGKPTERKEINPGDGWSELTPEQAAYIVEHQGQLPPDVNDEALYAAPADSN